MNLNFLQTNIDITDLSNFKTKAEASYYFELHSRHDIDKLVDILDFAKRKSLPLLFVSWGTNMLFAFDKYKGIVVKNCLQWWIYNKDTRLLETYSNELISDIAKALELNYWHNLWHRFIWLPGAIWWAIYWNAWCFWLEIENNFREVEVLNLETRQIEILSKKDMDFSYRSSILKKTGKYFIIKAIFDLSKKVEKYSSKVDNIKFREEIQPKWNTCGSFFKNPNKEQSAWYLIEQIWFKWYRLRGAYFSEKHANFLMNDGVVTFHDLLNLIKIVQEKVRLQFAIDLEAEVRIVYN